MFVLEPAALFLYFAGMRILNGTLLLSLLLLAACGGAGTESPEPENYLDAARNFVRAALDGKFREARRYMVDDSVNTNWMDITERNYNKSDAATRDGYRASSINIHKSTPASDSLAYVIYSNSFKNDHDTLKLLLVNGTWKVDLKYLFEHDLDSASAVPAKDTLR